MNPQQDAIVIHKEERPAERIRTEYEIVSDDHPLLKQELAEFDFANPPIDPNQLAADLVDAMLEYGGIGLSANQVGLPHRVFVMKTTPATICFNPRIVDESEDKTAIHEGCLSFPGLSIKNIKRSAHIKVRFQKPSGETVTEKYSGLTARVFLHEYDHMQGITFFRRASDLTKGIAINKWKKLKKLVEQKRKMGYKI